MNSRVFGPGGGLRPTGRSRRILLCAFACRPYAGSEPMVGWSAYEALRTRHQVKVICSGSGIQAIQKAVREGQAAYEDFYFVPERWPNVGRPAIDKLTVWLNTFSFQRNLARTAAQVIRDFRPDVIHQVTIATWRAGNPLAGQGIPFVWGPVGGGEDLPAPFLSSFSGYSRFFELLRKASGYGSRHSPGVLRTARQADWIFAGNHPTAQLLKGLRGHGANLEILPVVAFPELKMQEFSPRDPSVRRKDAPLQIFSGGYVEARKGMGLALQALVKLRARGFTFQYEHGGIGPEQSHLEGQIQREGLQDCVRFVPAYSGRAYCEKLRSTDVFLFPSLRENCGISLLEAMGHGCVPVVADHAGPGEIVTKECGVKIPLTNPKEFVERLAEELARLFQDPGRRQRLGEAARQRVLQNFSQAHWLTRVEHAYENPLGGRVLA